MPNDSTSEDFSSNAIQEPAVSIRNLHVSYGEREILHGITFDVPAGQTVVILGGSGSGKSTLLRTLVGLEAPTTGEVIVRGKNLRNLSTEEWRDLRQHIGISFQSGALFGSMTVGENVALPLHEHTELDPATIEIMVRLKLNEVGLNGYENYMPAQLSGGMKKRAAVARAMAMDPEILFFDEPSAGLDPIIAAGIDQLLLKLNELASAFLIADRMVLLDKGYIVANGRPEELKNSPHPRVRQFLDRIAEPELSQEIDYLQMLTGEVPRPRQ
jgi:phospholipid/cholesterol/gamma-HCH transport system ATP-binding protein